MQISTLIYRTDDRKSTLITIRIYLSVSC